MVGCCAWGGGVGRTTLMYMPFLLSHPPSEIGECSLTVNEDEIVSVHLILLLILKCMVNEYFLIFFLPITF